MVEEYHARGDFNGDGRSDILWRNIDGIVTDWLATANDGFVANWASFNHNLEPNWNIWGTGDFNGDGREDILLQSTSGILISWLQTASAGFQPDWENAVFVPTDWYIAGTADFNGDKLTDILWRNFDGEVTNWLSSPDPTTIVDVPGATFVDNWANAHFDTPADWNVAGLGDFDGDGHADILWRDDQGHLTDWLGQANGGFSDNSSNASVAVPLDWQVVGTGDFNGDGLTDILWRHDDGTLVNWLGQANGGFAENWDNSIVLVPTSWQIAGTGDYNGDHRDDILWRNESGVITDWLATEEGGFVENWANMHAIVPTNWLVQPNPTGAGLWDY